MKLVHAVFEHGIFRPTELVELPDGCEVDFEPHISVRHKSSRSNGVSSRIDELRLLNDGWLDGQGLAPCSEGLDWLVKSFEASYPDDLQPPFVYPTAEGGAQFEWAIGEHELSLQIDLSNHQAEWHSLNLKTQQDWHRDLNLDHSDDWESLVQELRRLAGGQS